MSIEKALSGAGIPSYTCSFLIYISTLDICLPTGSLGDLPGLLERVLDGHHAVLLLADQAVVLGPEHKVQLLRGQQSVHPILKL